MRGLVVSLLLVATAWLGAAVELYVPVVAQVEGADGGVWSTELWLSNLSTRQGSFAITFLPAGTNNSRKLLNIPEDSRLKPGETRMVRGVVPRDSTGALRLIVSAGVVVRCRVFRQSSRGSVGQIVPVLGSDDLIAAGQPANLAPLLRSGRFRTNVGIFNPGLNALSVEATLFSPGGEMVGRAKYEVEPASQIQVNDYLLGFDVERSDGHRVELLADGTFYAYASVVETRSGDPSLLTPLLD